MYAFISKTEDLNSTLQPTDILILITNGQKSLMQHVGKKTCCSTVIIHRAVSSYVRISLLRRCVLLSFLSAGLCSDISES